MPPKNVKVTPLLLHFDRKKIWCLKGESIVAVKKSFIPIFALSVVAVVHQQSRLFAPRNQLLKRSPNSIRLC